MTTNNKPGTNGLSLTNRKNTEGEVTVDIICNDATGVGLVGFKPSAILALPDLLSKSRAMLEAYEWIAEDHEKKHKGECPCRTCYYAKDLREAIAKAEGK